MLDDTFEREAWKALADESGVRLFSDDTPEEEKTNEDTNMKAVYAPGVVETLIEEVGEEEAKQIIADIERRLADGSFFDESDFVDLDQLEKEDPEAYEQICKQIEAMPVEEREAVKPTLH